MKIGLIVYSQTGNTLAVAMRLQDKLRSAGHESTIERLAPVGAERLELADAVPVSQPDILSYDALILAAPVQGAALAPAMTAALRKFPPLQGRRVVCYLTEFFPFNWMGGSRAIRQLTQIVAHLGGQLAGTGIIHWSSRQREQQITELVARFAAML